MCDDLIDVGVSGPDEVIADGYSAIPGKYTEFIEGRAVSFRRQWLPTHPEWWHPLLNLGSFVDIFGLLKFSQQFLHLRKKLSGARTFINSYLVILVLSSLLAELVPELWAAQVWRLLTGVGILTPLLLGILIRLQGYRPAGIFLAAVFIFVISAFAHLFSFVLFPAGQGGEVTYIFFKIGVVIMLALMALGMGYRNLNLRREKERALQQTLENQARINQRLLQLDHLKDQFLANTSHELRTPLNGIIGLAESLRDGATGELPETAREHLSMIAASGRRLNNLINDILDFSKLKSRELMLRKKAVRLQAVAHNVLILSQPLTKGKDLRLVNAIPNDTAPAEPFHPLANRESEIRILVVDDEAVNRQVLQNQISLAGYEVTAAGGGKEALDLLLNAQRYDLVILDIMMPNMSGYEVCYHLRKQYLPSELPVIMLTAKNHVTDLVEGFDAGANDYLTKPFLREELLSRIRTHLHLSYINRATGRFVPHEFLRTLGKRDITDVSLGDHEQLEVTVLFSDIRDYTTLSELMSPEDNFQFVNAYAGRMGPVIHHHGGFVQQYLGDAIMAIFQEHPQQALRAAVDMQIAIQRYNKERAQKGRRAIRVGMGVHTGSLIMGIIGDHYRNDAATIADTVNTASRLEGLTKHYGVNIILSEESRGRLQNPEDFHFRYLGRVQVKGKHQPVNIYECIDGDHVDTVARKLATREIFEKGLRQYYQKDFKFAHDAFEQVLSRNAHDTAARLFLQRSSRYLTDGVPDNWTGVEAMQFK